MRGLGLSPEQIEARRNYVQAGDVAPILAGKWNEVWRQKKGHAEPSLDDVLAVQMGSYTEPFNLAWFQQQTGRAVHYHTDNHLCASAWKWLNMTDNGTTLIVFPELVVSKRYPWLACNLDAMSTTSKGHRCTLDAKHVGALNEQTILRYTPGCTQQAIVCETDWWALSVFIGNSKWDVVEQEVDPFYAADIIEQTREFWRYVERDEEPRDREEPTAAPKPQKLLRNIDLSAEFGSEEWKALIQRNQWAVDYCNAVEKFRETDGAAKVHAMAREEMKALAPEDAGEIRRGDVLLKRNKAGAVTIAREAK